MRKAIIFGATGAIGQSLLNQLLSDIYYDSIIIVVRKPVKQLNHNRCQQIVLSSFEFNDLQNIDARIDSDDVFCCLGTTIKKAGSRSEFDNIDRKLVVNIAQWAKGFNANSFNVVSSMGADKNSGSFYLSVKGKMEAELIALKLNHLNIYRPSLLYGGKRNEFRLGETIGLILLYPLRLLPFKFFQKVAPIKVDEVAKGLIQGAKTPKSVVMIYDAEFIKNHLNKS